MANQSTGSENPNAAVLPESKQHLYGSLQWIRDGSLGNIMTIPVIYSLLFPVAVLDLAITIYQAICFPVYGIPKVKRSDHIILDRGHLKYLNWIEKAACLYCGYVNGMLSFSSEVAARTEQYFCPIKHARKKAGLEHSRQHKFCKHGDGKEYRERLEVLRNDWDEK